jgi:hypothetical protein
MKKIQRFIGLLLLAGTYSCANIGTPNGGPYDEEPPRFVSSKPAPGEVNYKGKKVEILFDELIQIDKPSENVIITPPPNAVASDPYCRAESGGGTERFAAGKYHLYPRLYKLHCG